MKWLHFLFSGLPVAGTKVFVMPGGMMKSNANLVDLIEKVKPEIRTLIEKCNTVSNVFKHHSCIVCLLPPLPPTVT